jgi:hypothetical protein
LITPHTTTSKRAFNKDNTMTSDGKMMKQANPAYVRSLQLSLVSNTLLKFFSGLCQLTPHQHNVVNRRAGGGGCNKNEGKPLSLSFESF